MSIEAGVLIGLDGQDIFWHLPQNRNGGSLPDSRELWDVIWENRDKVLGFAHSHPGRGIPGPSYEDVTTFAAVEAALGKRLTWWIISSNNCVELHWLGPEKYRYKREVIPDSLFWVERLRKESNY